MEPNQLQPGIQYVWSEEAEFTLNGIEFAKAFNTLEQFINSPLYQQVVQVGTLHEIMRIKLEKAVSEGVATPIQESSNTIPDESSK